MVQFDAFTKEAFSLLGVGLFLVGLRLYVRFSLGGLKRFRADDYLMIAAAVAYIIGTYLAFSVGAFWKGLANNGMTPEQRKNLDPSSEEYRLRVNGSKTQVAGWCTYAFLMWAIKASMCFFYLQLTDGVGFRKRILGGFLLLFITWLTVVLSVLLACRPLSKNWQIYPDPGNFCQPAVSRVNIYVTLVLNVSTDLYLLSIPIPMFWGSTMKPLKKFGLMLLFSGGLFVTAAAILRCVLIVTDLAHGAEKAGSWAVRETFVAIVTSNLPMVTPLIRRIFHPIIGTLKSLSYTGNRPSKASKSSEHQWVLMLENNRRGMGPRSVHPIPDFSANDSNEVMLSSLDLQDSQEQATRSISQEGNKEPCRTASLSDMSKVIVKKLSVEVTKKRKSEVDGYTDPQDIGDYYLIHQRKREEDRITSQTNDRDDRTGSNLGIGIAL